MAGEASDDNTVLLIHTGELDDVRDVLSQSGIAFVEGPPTFQSLGAYLGAPLVVSGPTFLLDCLRKGHKGAGSRIAILEGESRTARSMLVRGGVEWMVRRPVHPAALRLLVLHCLYNGPEKRKAQRVSIGAKVGLRSGWRPFGGILEEISVRDCRVLSKRAVAVGTSVKLRIPPEVAGGRALALGGRVVRTAPEGDGATEICLVFGSLPATVADRLRKIVAAHQRGPAVLQGADPRPRRDRDEVFTRSVIPIGVATPASEPAATGLAPNGDGDLVRPERRSDPRRVFERHVIATDEQATRVLVGRDISLGGMRVNPTPSLALGDELQIAVHVQGSETPLVINVEVARDDGEHGVLLHFRDLSKTAEVYLTEVLANLPGLSAGDGDSSSGEAPRVVSEILERRAG